MRSRGFVGDLLPTRQLEHMGSRKLALLASRILFYPRGPEGYTSAQSRDEHHEEG
jgi:hypothetical protein